MNDILIPHLIASTRNVFDRMLHLDVWAEAPEMRAESTPTYDVSAFIVLNGDIEGFVVLSLSADTARRVASVFAGSDRPLSPEDMRDALGEIVSIIAGGAMSRLDGLDVSIGIPAVVIGSSPVSSRTRNSTTLAVACTCDCGEFTIEAAAHPAISVSAL